MSTTTSTITNYDGSITATPQRIARPASVEELQEILRDAARYPAPVRAFGSYHSLTPCASSDGTMVSMEGLKKIIAIDAAGMTLTAQGGLEMIEANEALRQQNLQFILNIEIGNMTLGAAACCQSKDALDGVEFGQVNSYVTAMKWVTPSGDLAEASEDSDPELLSKMRASYGLAGIVYEVTFRIKPIEIIKFKYDVHEFDELTEARITEAIASSQALVCWTIGRTTVIQTRHPASELRHEWLARSRRFGWNFLAAFTARAARNKDTRIGDLVEDLGMGLELGFYRLLDATGGFTLRSPDKMVNYSKTPELARYAFTFWTFPRADWVRHLKDYIQFAETYHATHGFRCNMPLGSYFIRQDTKSLLSYSWDGDTFSLDPIHAPGDDGDAEAWADFLRAFNEWASARKGRPLLNQSPFVTRQHVLNAYGDRWKTFSDWVRSVDPSSRMLNAFFRDLLVDA
jgi:FAD/FMN-containing dehydrogenase